jgi:hypothetical protein
MGNDGALGQHRGEVRDQLAAIVGNVTRRCGSLPGFLKFEVCLCVFDRDQRFGRCRSLTLGRFGVEQDVYEDPGNGGCVLPRCGCYRARRRAWTVRLSPGVFFATRTTAGSGTSDLSVGDQFASTDSRIA